jgi:gliding motility-associated-like protein
VRNPADGDTYAWDFGDGGLSAEKEPQHLYSTPGNYKVSVLVTSKFGCKATDTLDSPIEVSNGVVFKVPNAFSPNLSASNGGVVDENADGLNDVFYPVTEGMTKIKLRIYNRWGEMLFESNSLNIGWDGYVKGKLSPPDTYVFTLEAKFINGEIKKKTGDVTLIR